MTEGKLVFLPKGYRVVPAVAIEEIISMPTMRLTYIGDTLRDCLYEDNVPDTPPVLRWDGLFLKVGNKILADVWQQDDVVAYRIDLDKGSIPIDGCLKEARRAAEKALGFPDGLVVEEV